MSLSRLMGQPVLVQPMTTTKDEYGNDQPSTLGAPVSETGYLEQKDTVEYQLDRETVVSRWTCYLHASSVVTALSQITFNTQTFQVDGEPWHAWNPRTSSVSHIECKLTVVS